MRIEHPEVMTRRDAAKPSLRTSYLLPLIGLLLVACNPSAPDPAARQSGTVEIGASASVRVNGKPLAHAAGGERAGRPLLTAQCATDGLEQSPNVRINGAPATVVETGANPADCRPNGDLDTADDVRVGG